MLYACPNSYASHSSPHRGGDPHVVAVSYGHAHLNSGSHCDFLSYPVCNSHPVAVTYRNPHAIAFSNAHSHTVANSDPHTYAHGNVHTVTVSYGDPHADTSPNRNTHSNTAAHCDLHTSTYGDFHPGSNGDLLAHAVADSRGYPVADTYSNPHAAARRPEMEVPHSELGGCRSGGLGRDHLHRFTGPESIRIR